MGTFLYGRRLYETMAVWETDAALAAQSDLMADFASAWQAASKVVYSTTLAAVSTANTRLERRFDPAAVTQLKATASSDLTVGGAQPRGAGFHRPGWSTSASCSSAHVVGGGKPALPTGIAPTSSSSTSADSETASYTSATALSECNDSDRHRFSSHRRTTGPHLRGARGARRS